VTVTLPGRVRAVAAGFQHTCALVSDGSAYCWGRNHAGQLGNNTAIDASEPQLVVGDARFINITAGSLHTCGVAVNGRAWCWGENVSGQLGAGVSTPASGRPLAVSGNQAFYSVVAGPSHTCGRARDGRILCWGRNNQGQLGNGTTTNQSRPVVATGVNGLVGLHTFGSHTCGVTANGDAWCWGANTDGQLGDAKRENATVPRRVRAPN
jgi:alpha-tubulin suppressor-like RCC1 family protein